MFSDPPEHERMRGLLRKAHTLDHHFAHEIGHGGELAVPVEGHARAHAARSECFNALGFTSLLPGAEASANAMESAHVLARGEVIELADLPVRLQSPQPAAAGTPELCLTEIERRTIAEALRRTDYCKAKASRMLGINIQRLNRRIDRLKISTRRA